MGQEGESEPERKTENTAMRKRVWKRMNEKVRKTGKASGRENACINHL